MKTYLDSSAVVRLYYPEKNSQELACWVLDAGEPVPYTSLHELEITNAFALKVFRGEIQRTQQEALLQTLKEDLEKGVLERVLPNWGEVFSQALTLSERYTSRSGCRSLDILHVSLACTSRFEGFLTFDERQAKLAKSAGLKVVSLSGRSW